MTAEIELLAGETHTGEAVKAIQACNDYLRMGPGRSLAKLWQKYGETTAENPPTTVLRTLESWSTRYNWQERVVLWSAKIEQEKTARHAEVMQAGLAVPSERVIKLKELAAQLGDYIAQPDMVWLPDVKQIGGGEFAERVDIVRFNSSLIEQFRGVLDDIAKETGGRRQTIDHLVKNIDLTKLSDEQLDRISAGEDPLQVIMSGYVSDSN